MILIKVKAVADFAELIMLSLWFGNHKLRDSIDPKFMEIINSIQHLKTCHKV